MATKSIECQIATSQIGRYLSGDPFSPDALKQLEAHVAECPECKASLVQRRAILQAMLGGATAVAEVEDAPQNVAGALRELTGKKKARQEQSEAPVLIAKSNPAHFWKPFGYSLALGAVLVGMRVYSKPFGETVLPQTNSASATKAVETTAPVAATPAPATPTAAPAPTTATGLQTAVTTPATTVQGKTAMLPTATTVQTKPAATETKSTQTEATKNPTNGAKPTDTSMATGAAVASTNHSTPPTPAPAFTLPEESTENAPKAARHKKAHRKTHHVKKAHRAANPTAIRVYDPSGNLISK